MIRRASAADADALLALERSAPEAAHWSATEYTQILQTEDTAAIQRIILIAEEDGAPLGFIVVKLLDREDQTEAEIENLAISSAARRQGIGSALCAAALEACTAAQAQVVELEVRAGNRAALALYARFGFRQAGIRAAYYANPKEDAVLLRISLQNQ